MGYVGLGVILVGAIILFVNQGFDTRKHSDGMEDLKRDLYDKIRDVRQTNDRMSDDLREMKPLCNETIKVAGELTKEVEAMQEHLAKMREQQIWLKDKYLPKRVHMSWKGSEPVPIAIVKAQDGAKVPKGLLEKAGIKKLTKPSER